MSREQDIERQVWDILESITDPCSERLGQPLSLVGMGLVEGVDFDGSKVHVRLVLTDASCVFYFSFAAQVEDRARALEGVDDVEVSVETTVLWTPERIAAPTGPA